ncbi:uncharacterized protein BDV17DRAFT_293598 [Aspergillus undulatus]|uniref:uncharacterized protein n=1 Tax=Aspergillus undulatus TaxID=1810928 RepID=UPI003CCDC3BF
MDFGFSPGDIALFTKFTWKFILALKENGSKFEFQQALSQCEALLSFLEKFKRLNLSSALQYFRQKLSEQSVAVQNPVKEFKKSIDKYEKSMGRTTTRNTFHSAPRKVQWALLAAEDIKNLKIGLQGQLYLSNPDKSYTVDDPYYNNVKEPIPQR